MLREPTVVTNHRLRAAHGAMTGEPMPHVSLHSPPAIMFGCQHLAAAVIKQAIADALDPLAPPTVRRDARQFLQGSEEYRFWCRLGGFDPGKLLETGPTPASRV